MGHTGCGKSQFGAFALACADIETMPWLVIDYKGDELLNAIPYAREINLSETPKHPGIHIVHPLPTVNDEHVENLLWRVWQRGNTGVFVDEAYTMPDKGAYQTLLVQGRSKQIPMINLTQKPAWVPSQVFSEADFLSVFHLTDRRDHRRVNEFMPVDLDEPLPEYWSHYYRVKDRARFRLRPVPDADTILSEFAHRLKPKRRIV
jgi:hypothetical protein